MKTFKKALSLTLAGVLASLTLTGCGGTAKNQTIITFYAGVSAEDGAAYKTMVETYNNGQGKTDGVYVDYKPKATGYDSDLSTVFEGKKVPDVITLSDQYFKGYTKDGKLYNIQSLIDNDSLKTKNSKGEQNLDMSEIPSVMVDRFRINWENKTAGNSTDDLYGIPNGSKPTFLYYNINALENAGVNIISISEDELDNYNSENSTSYLPRGYAEYAESAKPADGLKVSENLSGQKVIKVFNNQIAMNWDELLVLSKYCTKSYTSDSITEYGFLSEWWFSYGWSVGGDCMMWDQETNKYVFSLGNTNPGYIAVKDTTVNGASYKAGDIISNIDKTFLSKNVSNITGDLYKLPSQYDAFSEFCALSQKKDVAVDTSGKKG